MIDSIQNVSVLIMIEPQYLNHLLDKSLKMVMELVILNLFQLYYTDSSKQQFFDNIIFMSDFIDEKFVPQHLISNIQSQNDYSNTAQQKLSQNLIGDQVIKNLFKLVPNLTNEFYLQNAKNPHSKGIKLRLSFSNCGLCSLNALIDIKLDISKNSFQTFLTVLDNQKLFKIQNSNKRVLICKLFTKSSTKNFNKMSVCMASGTFKLFKPVNYFWDQNFNQYFNGKSKEKTLANYLLKTLQEGIQIFKPVLRQIIEDFEQDSNEKRRQSGQAIKRSIHRYIMKSSIQPSFDISFGSGKFEMMEFLTKGEIFNTNSLAKNIVTEFEEFNSHNIYLTPKLPLKSLRKLYARQYFNSNDEQLTTLKNKIEHLGTRLNYGMQSKYVYSMIQFNESSKINLRKFNEGGFSQISIAEVQFWYMLSASYKKAVKIDEITKQNQVVNLNKVKNQQKKVLVFKSNKYPCNESSRNRIAHQMEITSKFKGTSSIFIPEYFNMINQRSPFAQYLIMEYLPSPTLNQYTEIHKHTISFLTKIHLASLIIHALQILKNNCIVHMDIKPSNIIVGKRMIIKLFDFGQSYHKEVCDQNYKPAFSNPYGSPEAVLRQGKIEFTQKSDIYSWAVLIWQLIFKRYPFYLPLEKTTKVLKNKLYEQHIYYVPQDESQYGSWQIMPFIRYVLLKAMDKDLTNRPFTIWLTVVLKECLTHLINLEHNYSEE